MALVRSALRGRGVHRLESHVGGAGGERLSAEVERSDVGGEAGGDALALSVCELVGLGKLENKPSTG